MWWCWRCVLNVIDFEISTSSFWNNKNGLRLLTAGSYSLQQSHLNQIVMAYIAFFSCLWVIFWYIERHVDKECRWWRPEGGGRAVLVIFAPFDFKSVKFAFSFSLSVLSSPADSRLAVSQWETLSNCLSTVNTHSPHSYTHACTPLCIACLFSTLLRCLESKMVWLLDLTLKQNHWKQNNCQRFFILLFTTDIQLGRTLLYRSLQLINTWYCHCAAIAVLGGKKQANIKNISHPYISSLLLL